MHFLAIHHVTVATDLLSDWISPAFDRRNDSSLDGFILAVLSCRMDRSVGVPAGGLAISLSRPCLIYRPSLITDQLARLDYSLNTIIGRTRGRPHLYLLSSIINSCVFAGVSIVHSVKKL